MVHHFSMLDFAPIPKGGTAADALGKECRLLKVKSLDDLGN